MKFVFLIVLFLLPTLVPAQEKATVLEVDLLIDGTGKEPLKDAVIVIEGQRVKAIGRKGEVPVPSGARVVTGKGLTALPGLIDSHAHYKDWQGELYLNHGVTTALAIGSEGIDWIAAQRDGIAKGKIVGPRLFVAGPHFNSPGPGERRLSLRDLQARRRGEISVSNAEAAGKAARELIAAGADIIKVYEYSTPEVIRALAEEARKAGKPIGGHSEDILMSAESGYEFVEHSHAVVSSTIKDPQKRASLNLRRSAFRNRLSTPEYHYYADEENFDELVRVMVERKVSWAPTLATFWRFYSPKRERFKEGDLKLLSNPNLTYIPPYFSANIRQTHEGIEKIADAELLKRVKAGYGKIQDFIRRFVKAGGKIRVGSDPNSILPGWAIHVEMELLVEAGLTPMEAILAATRNPAEQMHRENDLGAIKPGSLADVVVVEGNPLEDISRTRNIKMVFKEGREVRLGYDKTFDNPIPLLDGDRPQPEIDRIMPASVVAGKEPVTLTVEGGNFMSTSVVLLDGAKLPTKVEIARPPYPQNFDRGRKLTAVIDPKLIARAGTYEIRVVEPGFGGTGSNPLYLIVRFP
jgi:hypothetical protein